MAVTTNRCTNANVYFDGTSWLGKILEVEAPDVISLQSEVKALGMFGQFELPTGIDKMVQKLKLASYDADVFGVMGDFTKPHSIQIRGNVETWGSAGRASQTPAVLYLTGMFKKFPGGAFKQHENTEFETELNILYFKSVLNGADMLEVDILNNIYKVKGVDLLADFRANLGI